MSDNAKTPDAGDASTGPLPEVFNVMLTLDEMILVRNCLSIGLVMSGNITMDPMKGFDMVFPGCLLVQQVGKATWQSTCEKLDKLMPSDVSSIGMKEIADSKRQPKGYDVPPFELDDLESH